MIDLINRLAKWLGFLALATCIQLWANYQWRNGFEAGADTSLCVMHHARDGKGTAMRTEWCQRIKGKTPPFDIYRDALRARSADNG